jgi:hypothetical protein
MNQDLAFEPTILVPFNADGGLDDVRESLQDGIKKVERELRESHPDAAESDILHTLWQVLITNWSISAIAANEWERRFVELEKELKDDPA